MNADPDPQPCPQFKIMVQRYGDPDPSLLVLVLTWCRAPAPGDDILASVRQMFSHQGSGDDRTSYREREREETQHSTTQTKNDNSVID